MQEFEYKREYQLFTEAVVNVTNACNLQCIYCFVEQQPEWITMETMKDIINLMAKNYEIKSELNLLKKNEKCLLYFFGGEPLLEYPTIKFSVEYANKNYPNLFNFGITTNGTYLFKDRIDFFKENNFSILLSIDGDKITQDHNRPTKFDGYSSFDMVIQNIPYLLENFPSTCFRSTVSLDIIDRIFTNYLFAEQLGFKSFFAMPDHRSKWPQEKVEIIKEQIEKIFFYRTNQYLNNISPMEFQTVDWAYRFILDHDIKQITNSFIDIDKYQLNINRCGLGTTNVVFGPNGNIYSCQEQPSRTNSNLFYLGNIYKDGIEKERHIQLINTYLNDSKVISSSNPNKCQNCLQYKNCFSNTCISTSYDLFNNFSTRSEIRCDWNEIFLKNAIIQMSILVEKNNKNFKDYLNHISLYKKYFNQEEQK